MCDCQTRWSTSSRIGLRRRGRIRGFPQSGIHLPVRRQFSKVRGVPFCERLEVRLWPDNLRTDVRQCCCRYCLHNAIPQIRRSPRCSLGPVARGMQPREKRNDEDVKLAARSLHASLSAAHNIDVGAFDCQIMIDVTGRPGFITLAKPPQSSANGAFNFDRQRHLQHEERRSALRQLEGARAARASLCTIVISVDDARARCFGESRRVARRFRRNV